MTKTARDYESETMLDIIFNNKIYDIGTFNTNLQTYDIFWAAVNNRRTDLMSLIEAREGAITAAIERFNEDY